MQNPDDETLKNIQKRLDVLIALTLKREMKEDESTTMRDLIAILSSLGLKYTEIASIFGKSSSYIASELTQIRKTTKGANKQ